MSTPAAPSFKMIGGDGKEYGPVDLGTLQQWARDGRLKADTQVWDSRTGAWQPAGQVAEVAGMFAASAPPPTASAAVPPTPPGMMLADQILQRGYTVDFGNWYSQGWQFFKANMGFVIGATWLTFLVVGVLSAIPCVGAIASLVLQPPLIGGLWLVLLNRRRGLPATVGQIFDGFKLFFLQSFLANLVMTVFILLGTVCLILPGIYLAVSYVFVLPLVADRRMDFWPAMETSRRVVSKHWFAIFGYGLVTGLISLAGVLACGIGLVFTIPLAFCFFVVAYDAIFSAAPASSSPSVPVSA